MGDDERVIWEANRWRYEIQQWDEYSMPGRPHWRTVRTYDTEDGALRQAQEDAENTGAIIRVVEIDKVGSAH